MFAFALAPASACGDDGGRVPDAAPTADASIAAGAITPFPELYCPGSATCQTSGNGVLRVGAARADITPDLARYETEWSDDNSDNHWQTGEPFVDENGNGDFDAVWIAGFDNGRPATSVHDQIWVRAMVFEIGDTRVGLAVIDAIGWFANEMDSTRELIDPALELDHVIIASLHIHETPDTIGLWGKQQFESGLDLDYQALVREATANAIAEAVVALEPVTMSVAETMTLDGGMADAYVSDTRDPVVIDPTMTVVRFAAAADPARTVATLVHWSNHPEYAWSRNNEITADYVYWVRDIVENGAADNPARGLPALDGLGGEVVFLNGTVGGLLTPSQTRPIGPDGQPVIDHGMAQAEAAGINLGRLALEAITDAAAVVDVPAPDIEMRTGRMYLTVENTQYHVGALLGIFDRQFFGYDTSIPISTENLPYLESRVSYLRVGNVAVLSTPGELFSEIAVGGYDGSRTYGFEFIDPQNPNPPVILDASAGPYLKDLMRMQGVTYPLIGGMTEDFLGYIPPSYDYILHPESPYFDRAEGDHYEETNSIGPKAEEEIVGAMVELLQFTPPGS
jgi:hypothetical protein